MAVIELSPVQAILTRPIPGRVATITMCACAILVVAGVAQGYPLYVTVTMGLVPWIPAFIMEARWQFASYHWLAPFFAISVLQVGHLGEHAVQVSQLVINDGALVHSHGVFGQLDFETVHFFWDTAIWLGTLALFWRYGRGNAWLCVSLLFASLHEVEHMYLYYVSLFEPSFYHDHGGFAGILGKGGILPTVSRPYLHFGYNFMVVIPMVIAYVGELGRARGDPSRRVPLRADRQAEISQWPA